MGRFAVDEAENYGSKGSSNFFSLKNDMDVANVRFMYNDIKDVEGFAVHEVEVEGKKRVVNCLRKYDEPKSKCPLCAADNFQRAKFYVPVYDTATKEVKIWERGKEFRSKLSALCARYANSTTPLVAHTFDIERHGKPKDTNTKYEIFETGSDNTRIEDLPEIPDILGSIVLDKTASDMEYYLEHDCFPNNDGAPKRDAGTQDTRNSANSASQSAQPTGRRTPSRRGDGF